MPQTRIIEKPRVYFHEFTYFAPNPLLSETVLYVNRVCVLQSDATDPQYSKTQQSVPLV